MNKHKGGEEGDDIEEQIEKKGKLGKKKERVKNWAFNSKVDKNLHILFVLAIEIQ